jgi:hypothetical protein
MSSSSPPASQNTPTPTKDAKISSPTVYRQFNDRLKSGLVPKSADIEVKLLRHLVDTFGMATAQERVAAFKRITFPSTLQALEQYIGMTGWLRAYLPSYAHAVDPMQERKTQLLEAGPKIDAVDYCAKTIYEPTPQELAAFEKLQSMLTVPRFLVHFPPDRGLLLNSDVSQERGFSVMAFHLATRIGTIRSRHEAISIPNPANPLYE